MQLVDLDTTMFNDSTPIPACQAHPHHMGGHGDTSRLNVEEVMVTWGCDEGIAWEYGYNMDVGQNGRPRPRGPQM